MWELDHKENRVLKNWCFWTVVLEKTLESPLDCKEIQPVNLKGNPSWMIIVRTDAEAETPILWPPDTKNWLIGKDPDAGRLKVGGEGDNRGWDCWMASQTQWTWVWVNSGNWWWTRRPDMLQSIGSQRDRHDWATELNWTESWNVRCPGICSIAVPIKSRRSEKIIPVGPHLLYGEWKPVSKCFPLLASMLTALRHTW